MKKFYWNMVAILMAMSIVMNLVACKDEHGEEENRNLVEIDASWLTRNWLINQEWGDSGEWLQSLLVFKADGSYEWHERLWNEKTGEIVAEVKEAGTYKYYQEGSLKHKLLILTMSERRVVGKAVHPGMHQKKTEEYWVNEYGIEGGELDMLYSGDDVACSLLFTETSQTSLSDYSLVGRWYYEEIDEDGKWRTFITFEKNGTYQIKEEYMDPSTSMESEEKGTYTYIDNTLTMTTTSLIMDGYVAEYAIGWERTYHAVVSGTTLRLSWEEEGEVYTEVYSKVNEDDGKNPQGDSSEVDDGKDKDVTPKVTASVSYHDYAWYISITTNLHEVYPDKSIKYGIEFEKEFVTEYYYGEEEREVLLFREYATGSKDSYSIVAPVFYIDTAMNDMFYESYVVLIEKQQRGEELSGSEEELLEEIQKVLDKDERDALDHYLRGRVFYEMDNKFYYIKTYK